MGSERHAARTEALIFLTYYALFFAYNWLAREPDLLHWLSLVALPLALVYGYRRIVRQERLGAVLASVGLRRGHLLRGLPLAILVGLGLSCLQLIISDRREAVWAIIVSGRVLVYLPLVIVLLALTAGFTEEFFFRGVLQTRLASWFSSELVGLILTSALFGLYHLPYVYLAAASGLHGHLGDALLECGYDAVAGLVIGLVFWRSRHNLLAAVTVHVLIDALPVMTMLHFSIRF